MRLMCQLCFFLFNIYFMVGPYCTVTDVWKVLCFFASGIILPTPSKHH